MRIARPASHRRTELGFTTIELIIAMVIMAILMSVIAMSFRGSKGSAAANETKVAAGSYAAAISQYQADHGNRNPLTWASISGKWAGPLNLVNKPYMKNLPGGVAEGRVGVSTNGACTQSGTYGYVCYVPGTEPDFEIQAFTRNSPGDPWPGSPTCYAGKTAATPRC